MLYFNLLLFYSLAYCDGAKILAVIPTPHLSHQVVFQRFAHELANRGHTIVMITSFPGLSEENEHVTEINIRNITYAHWRESVLSKYCPDDYYKIRLKNLFIAQEETFERILENREFKQIVGGSFDLLLLENVARPWRALAHIFKVPVLTLSSLGTLADEYNIIGSPVHPILYPICIQQKIHRLTLMEKMYDLYNTYFLHKMLEDVKKVEGISKSEYFNDILSVSELRNNVDMTILNVYHIWEQNRPIPLSLVYAGALHLKSVQELPEDLKNYLDSSANGVIYVSFGSSLPTSLLPASSIQVMVKVLSTLPYSVLWKWNEDHLPGQANNIRISKWLPQADLLRHPKIKLFITQAGLQSTDEAIAAGVPLLGLPTLGDQWYNAENYVRHSIGLKLDLETLREEEFRSAIETLIYNDSYRHNVRRFGALVRDSPQSALKRTVWWTEHILRHGTAHLRAPARNLSWTEYLEIELMLIVFTCISLSVVSAISIVYYARCIWIGRLARNIFLFDRAFNYIC